MNNPPSASPGTPLGTLLDALLDPGTFWSWDDGGAESVVTGTGLLRGHRVSIDYVQGAAS